jgi:hypothetical protein
MSNYHTNDSMYLADNESDVHVVPVDTSVAEHPRSLGKGYVAPKIWMNFEDFCTCFS